MAIAADHGIEYGKIFGSWQIRELIGTGSKGRTKVYRITKDAQGGLVAGEERALKAVTICEDADLEEMTTQARADYNANRETLCEKACNEVLLLKRLEGAAHIVGYLDWEIRDRTGGTDLLIAMHLLETLEVLQKTRDVFCEVEVLQVGMDICEALVRCQEEGIVHRDIKPANIFRRPDGRGGYMLGDFGVSRIVDNGMGASTDIGTPAYAAPEQVRTASGYDSRVDIYSLGVVLYELSNRNRLPFAGSRYSTEEIINRRVILGETIPVPAGASPALASVILKACAFHPEDRFQTAQELLDALEGIKHARPADAGKPAPGLPEDPYATMPLAAFARENPTAASPVAKIVSAAPPQAEIYFGQEQARALLTDDMLRAMNGYGSSCEEEKTCRWMRLAIPRGYTEIEAYAFQGILPDTLHVGRLILPDTVKKIQEGAFEGLEVLDFIEIPDSVQVVKALPRMGAYAYVKSPKNSPAWEYAEASGYQTHTQEWLTQPYAEDLTDACENRTELIIPRGYKVIAAHAFDNGGTIVERVFIPDTVEYIQNDGLSGLVVQDYIEVPASVKHMGKDKRDPYLFKFAYVKCRGSYAREHCKRWGIPTSQREAKARRTFGPKQAKQLFSKVVLEDKIELVIPDDYMILAGGAFGGLRNHGEYLIVDRVILPNEITTIEERAFDGVIVSEFIEFPAWHSMEKDDIHDFPYLGPDAYVKCSEFAGVSDYCREHQVKYEIINLDDDDI